MPEAVRCSQTVHQKGPVKAGHYVLAEAEGPTEGGPYFWLKRYVWLMANST